MRLNTRPCVVAYRHNGRMVSPPPPAPSPVTIPVTVTQLADDDMTWVSFEYNGRRYRFSVRGSELPFEVCYLHDFGLRGNERQAWFTVAPEQAVNPRFFEEQLYPQLVRLHASELARRDAMPTPA